MGTMLDDIASKNAAGGNYIGLFVVYDLPDRDCAAAASNGEYSIANNGVANYKGYIDDIVTQLKAHPNVQVALVIGTSTAISSQGFLLTLRQNPTALVTWSPT